MPRRLRLCRLTRLLGSCRFAAAAPRCAADRAGLYEIDRRPDGKRQFAANVLFRDTSDLTACQTGRWGNWNRSPTYQDKELALGWMFLLAAVAL